MWGKLLGGAFGFMIGGPIGAVLGAVLGHSFDKGMLEQLTHDKPEEQLAPGDAERIKDGVLYGHFFCHGLHRQKRWACTSERNSAGRGGHA